MHARRPFASSAEEEEANRAAASAAEVALDEEGQPSPYLPPFSSGT